jgi:1-acyl-sn-glycerol-3-phosphate acyltransferase
VVVGYPHTTNWDFLVFLAVARHFRLRVVFFAHRGLFVGPIGWALSAMGGIPVQGGESAGSVVDQAVDRFASAERMILAIAPEGTRAADTDWRSGFWRIADAAGVPVVMGFVDGRSKEMGFGPTEFVDGDPDRWMALAKAFYADKWGLRPDRRGRLRLSGSA